MALPSVSLMGNLTNAPELRFTQAGKGWAAFTVACNERRKNAAGDWEDGDTTFVDVVSWRNAEAIARLAKGARVVVIADLKQREYEDKDGNKRKAYQLDATYVASLLYDAQGQPSGAAQVASKPSDPWHAAAPAAASDEETPF